MLTTKSNLYIKIFIIIGLALVLLIATNLLKGVVKEREYTQQEAIAEVSEKWGVAQTLSGPFLSVPYHWYSEVGEKEDKRLVKHVEVMHFLPSKLNVSTIIDPEKRHRGIYDIVVYNSNSHITGSFDSVDFSGVDVPLENIEFDKAYISYGLTDLRGIEKQIHLNWDNHGYLFEPGTVNQNIVNSGINSPIKLHPQNGQSYTFDFSIDLKGSDKLFFAPVGKVTDIDMVSTWADPSFNGSFLPDEKSISEDGFKAHWNVLHLNRNYPQNWKNDEYSIGESLFGVNLILPVDNYQKTERSIKYAILLIGFSFISFFFTEIIKKLNIHTMHYLLVGAALVIFYSLLLSISEHKGFNFAYLVSCLATVLLVFVYMRAVLKSTSVSLVVSTVLVALYTLVFVIIQMQNLSMLIGSVSLFVILAIIMFITYKINWDEIVKREPKAVKTKSRRAADGFDINE